MKTVLFDLDGTITDPGLGITNSVMYALEKGGFEVPPREKLYKFIGPPLTESFEKHCGVPREKALILLGYYREYYRNKGLWECSLFPGIKDVFKNLYDNGYVCALATSKPDIFAEQLAEHFDIKKYLSFIAGANLDGTRENKVEVIEHALKNLPGAVPSQTVMVGDRKFDIEGAKQFGLKSVGAKYGYGKPEEFENADAIAETPYDLYDTIINLI